MLFTPVTKWEAAATQTEVSYTLLYACTLETIKMAIFYSIFYEKYSGLLLMHSRLAGIKFVNFGGGGQKFLEITALRC